MPKIGQAVSIAGAIIIIGLVGVYKDTFKAWFSPSDKKK
jgi:hypothetical protein